MGTKRWAKPKYPPGRDPRGGPRPNSGRKPKPPPLRVSAGPEARATAAELARPFIEEAIHALVGTIRDRKADASARNAAAKHILDAAKPAEEAEAELDTSLVSDLDLARWILSILEGAADEVKAAEA